MEHVVQEQKASVENMKPPVQSLQRWGVGGGGGGKAVRVARSTVLVRQ